MFTDCGFGHFKRKFWRSEPETSPPNRSVTELLTHRTEPPNRRGWRLGCTEPWTLAGWIEPTAYKWLVTHINTLRTHCFHLTSPLKSDWSPECLWPSTCVVVASDMDAWPLCVLVLLKPSAPSWLLHSFHTELFCLAAVWSNGETFLGGAVPKQKLADRDGFLGWCRYQLIGWIVWGDHMHLLVTAHIRIRCGTQRGTPTLSLPGSQRLHSQTSAGC